jgi:hypothetical protein
MANRVLFGEELARDPRWQQASIEYSAIMAQGADLIRNYPEFLKPLVLWYKTPIARSRDLARECLHPIIKARTDQELQMIAEGRVDEWNEIKPRDSIQWVMDLVLAQERDVDDIMFRMLHITAAAVHTTSFTFAEALHCIAAAPQYVDELRDEIVTILRQEGGWSKQAMTYVLLPESLDSTVIIHRTKFPTSAVVSSTRTKTSAGQGHQPVITA